MFCISKKITNIAENPDYLKQKFYGHHRKSLTEDMVCFLQASTAYLNYYKESGMHCPKKNQQLTEQGCSVLKIHEMRLAKYMDRMFDLVQCRLKKYGQLSEQAIFQELDKVITCQLTMEMALDNNDESQYTAKDGVSSTLSTNVPLLDIILNIDLFTAHFGDRQKVVRIIKELFNHCTNMKKLLLKHGNLILNILMRKYDKKCHLYQNKALNSTLVTGGKLSRGDRALSFDQNSRPDSKDEFLAVYIGQLIRLYAKSKSLS